jgi:hypothetical protein
MAIFALCLIRQGHVHVYRPVIGLRIIFFLSHGTVLGQLIFTFGTRFKMDRRFRTAPCPAWRWVAHRILFTGFETLLSPENCTLDDILATFLRCQAQSLPLPVSDRDQTSRLG